MGLSGIYLLAGIHGGVLAASSYGLARRREGALRLAIALLVLGLLVNTAVLGQRWIETGRAPFKTLFETMLLYPWCVSLVALALLGLHRLRIFLPCAAAVCLAGLGYALLRPDADIVLLPPALQSGWFVPHVVTYFMAYAGLFAAFALAVSALAAQRRLAWQHHAEALGRRAHEAAAFGFTALTLGLLMGGAWGKFAWGDYWSWDVKENWALISWLAYLTYFHLRLLRGWGPQRSGEGGPRGRWLLVGSFAVVVFTYLGMHLLPTAEDSLHVYQ